MVELSNEVCLAPSVLRSLLVEDPSSRSRQRSYIVMWTPFRMYVVVMRSALAVIFGAVEVVLSGKETLLSTPALAEPARAIKPSSLKRILSMAKENERRYGSARHRQ